MPAELDSDAGVVELCVEPEPELDEPDPPQPATMRTSDTAATLAIRRRGIWRARAIVLSIRIRVKFTLWELNI
jgi:hypothetical protein